MSAGITKTVAASGDALAGMLDESNFISQKLHEVEVTLGDGEKHKLHFRELAAEHFMRFTEDSSSKDDGARYGAAPRLIAESLRTPDGKPAITRDKAALLKPKIQNSLMNAILVLNGVGGRGKAGNG